MIKKSLLSLVFLVFSSPAFATDYTAASCENKAGKLDVQTAVNAASAAGDRVLIPAGTCTWSVAVGIKKAITLQGAGVGRTILRNGTPNGMMIEWYLVHGKDQRLTGIEFNMNGGGNPNPNGTLTIIGDRDVTTRFRLDHNKFDRLSAFGVVPMMVRGVFDHNEFIFVDSTTPVYVYDDGAGYGDAAWAGAVGFGSADFLFLEDNIFTNVGAVPTACTDGFKGSRVVNRFNTATLCEFENHGTESSGRARGGNAMETYANTLSGQDAFVGIRSGATLTWGNIGTSRGINAVNLVVDRTIYPFYWSGGADGLNPLDVNDATVYETNVATGGGTNTLVRAGAGWTPHQWVGYTITKTTRAGGADQWFSVIADNTVDTLIFAGTGGFAQNSRGADMSFSAGNGYTIRKVKQSMDQPGVSGGGLFTFNGYLNGTVSAGVATINYCCNVGGLKAGDKIIVREFSTAGGRTYDGAHTVLNVPSSTSIRFNCATCSGPLTGGEVDKVPSGWNNQVVTPSRQWLNRTLGSYVGTAVNATCIGVCVNNSTYYDYIPSGFNGKVGIGSGTRAAMNAITTCTKGVGFWVTDEGAWNDGSNMLYTGQGRLYECGASNNWSLTYTPAAYPHPMVKSGSSPAPATPARGR